MSYTFACKDTTIFGMRKGNAQKSIKQMYER